MSEEPWECPICYKTVYVGYTVHRHCLDELISKFVEKLKGKWKYLTVHMYEMKFDPNYEEEVESVFKELIKEYEEKLK